MRSLLVTVIVGWMVATGVARGAPRESEPLPSGAWALQFRVSSNFTVGAYEGGALSLKRQLSPSLAIRGGVGISKRSDDVTSEEAFGDSLGAPSDRGRTSYAFDLTTEIIVYPRPKALVKPFLGAGPVFEFEHSRDDATFGVDSGYRRDYDAYGGRVFLGAEWLFDESFSLHAEYGVRMLWYTEETTARYGDGRSPSMRTTRTDGWSVTAQTAFLGLSVYF